MNTLELRTLIRVSQGGVALFFALTSVRLGYVAWTTRTPTTEFTPTPEISTGAETTLGRAPIPHDLLQKLRMPAAPLPSELLGEHPTTVPATAASAAPKHAAARRVYVAIHQGPPRTEVRLNGVLLGQTPYVGEISCESGQPLDFVLIPQKGAPRHSQHVCDRTEIVLSEPTPDGSTANRPR
jgi:hypothetical protein